MRITKIIKTTRKKSRAKNAVLTILLLLCFIRPLALVIQERNNFFSPGYAASYETLRKAYYSSQYVKKVNPGIIPDNTFESFVGGAFIKGENPIHIVHEHPPLGRYIIGLSILIFDNSTTIILPLTLITLIGLYLISKSILINPLISLIPVIIFANEPLFLSKFQYAPLLEPIQMTFIVLALYFFINGVIKDHYGRYFILSSIALGFVISIRFFILGAALVTSMFLFLFLKKQFNRRFLIFILSLPLSLVILILSYTKTIQEGYSIFQVFSIQKYIFFYHKSKLANYFSFWDLIMFNRWHTWWGDRRIIFDPEWFFIWPISIVISYGHILLGILKKIRFSDSEIVISLWILCYCILLSIGFSTTRYFFALTPFLYIISISLIVKVIKLIYKTDK